MKFVYTINLSRLIKFFSYNSSLNFICNWVSRKSNTILLNRLYVEESRKTDFKENSTRASKARGGGGGEGRGRRRGRKRRRVGYRLKLFRADRTSHEMPLSKIRAGIKLSFKSNSVSKFDLDLTRC